MGTKEEKRTAGSFRIIAGDTYSAAASAAIRGIDSCVETVVIVPDRFTLQTEKLILKTLGLPGSFNISVSSFDRLFYSLCGQAKIMPAASAVMLLQKIISRNAKALKCFYRSAEFPGFAEKIYGVITKLKSNGVTPAALKGRAGNGALLSKLEDICLLYEKYEEESSGFLDINDRAQRLADYIAAGRAGGCRVVLLGFNSVTRAEILILKQFILSGSSLTAAAAYSQGHSAYTNELYNSLLSLASESGVEPETVFLPLSPRAPVFSHLYGSLGRYPYETAELKNNALTVYEAPDAWAETRKVAEMITVYARRGRRFNDMAVICTEPEQYAPAIESIFSQYDISFFINEPTPLEEHPMFSYVTGAIEARLKGFAAPDVLIFLKNPYFNMHGVTDEEKNIFENYCLRFGISRNGFSEEFVYDGDGGERERDEREISEGVRKKLMRALNAFAFKKNGTDYAVLIESLLNKSEEITLRLAAVSEYRAAELLRQGAAGFRAAASEIKRLFGDEEITPRQFRDVFRRGCGLYRLSAIPETQDCVQVGAPGITRICPPKILFILNAREGSLPMREDDSGIINDTDNECLKSGGITYVPSVSAANARAAEEIFQAVVSPVTALHISYPLTGPDGKPCCPAGLVTEIVRVFTKGGRALAPYNENYDIFDISGGRETDKRKAARLSADIYAPSDKIALRSLPVLSGHCLRAGRGGAELAALYASLTARGKITEGRLPRAYRPRAEAIAEADRLFFYKGATKVSQIESFYACPYGHFLEYGLRLKERPLAEPDGANIGTLLHAVLEKFFKEGMARGGGELFDETAALPQYAAALRNPSSAPVFKRLRRESEKVCAVLKEQREFSSFKPEFFEFDFLKDGAAPLEIGIGGRRILLSGKIDRADTLVLNGKKYARVVDYKSGVSGAKLTYSNLAKGMNLQLLVYLAYMRGIGYAPAGAFYFRVHNTEKDYRMNGVINRENDIPRYMDLRLGENEFRSEIINVATTKKGAYRKHPYALTEGELNGLCDYALEMLRGAGQRIRDGECAVFPLEDACKFCPYGGVCLFDGDKDETRAGEGTFRTAEELLGHGHDLIISADKTDCGG